MESTPPLLADSVRSDSDITDVDAPVQFQHSTLMLLLTGNQKPKRKKERLEDKMEDKPEIPTEKNSSMSDITDDSFTEDQIYQKEHQLLELEKKFYGGVQADSVMNILRRKKKKVEEKEKNEAQVEEEAKVEHEVIEVKEKDEHQLKELQDISLQSVKSVPEQKGIAVKDLFKNFKKPRPSLSVTLHVSSDRLQEAANPFRTRGTHGSSSKSWMLAIMHTKPTLKVTLRLNKDVLKDFSRAETGLFTKGTGKGSKNASSFFQQMMQNASSDKKLTPLQKLKQLDPPAVARDQLHVAPVDALVPRSDRLSSLQPKVSSTFICDIGSESLELSVLPIVPSRLVRSAEKVADRYAYVLGKFPESASVPALARILHDFITPQHQLPAHNWPQLYEPQNCTHLLVSEQNKNRITHWVHHAFARLKEQSYKTPRNVLIKAQQKRQKNDGFIVADDFLDEEADDIFVPVLIVHGSTGVGKSTAVYAVMKELGGYIHEVNSGQPRGRKDIYNSLKELGTTQLVHSNGPDREFQKGIILFEDCDVLFDQDKGFWLVVLDIVNISKRPVVLTCTDITTIPRNIYDYAAEEDAIVSLEYCDQHILKQYLWMCGVHHGFDLGDSILSEFIQCYGGDLRKLLMEAEMLCKHPATQDTLVKVEKVSETEKLDDLRDFNKIDLVSVSDVISSNTASLIGHEIIVNELVDIYFVDDLSIQKPPLPYEINLGEQLQRDLTDYTGNLEYKREFNDMKQVTNDFVGSRSKKLSKLVQEAQLTRSFTRSGTEFSPEPTGLPDISICHSLSRTPYVLDFAPFTRKWASFQEALDLAEERSLAQNNVSVKNFLGWRQFQTKPELVMNAFIRHYSLELQSA